MAELLCALGAEVKGAPLQTEVLPRVLRLAHDPAYLVRKVLLLPQHAPCMQATFLRCMHTSLCDTHSVALLPACLAIEIRLGAVP